MPYKMAVQAKRPCTLEGNRVFGSCKFLLSGNILITGTIGYIDITSPKPLFIKVIK
jgi:hypothetical protein